MKKHIHFLLLLLFNFSSFVFAESAFSLGSTFSLIKEFCLHPCEVGAISPSSSYVGEELSRFISINSSKKRHILEIGGGPGNITDIIASKMGPEDHLDMVEINPDLCEQAKKRLAKYKNVTVHCCSIMDWKVDFSYDIIISTLPFNVFSYDFFKKVFNHISTLGSSNVVFSYVEYISFGVIKLRLMFGDEEVYKIRQFLEKERSNHLIREKNILLNIPPLRVFHLRLNEI